MCFNIMACSLQAGDSNSFKTMVVFDCRGVEPVDFSPRVSHLSMAFVMRCTLCLLSLTTLLRVSQFHDPSQLISHVLLISHYFSQLQVQNLTFFAFWGLASLRLCLNFCLLCTTHYFVLRVDLWLKVLTLELSSQMSI